MRTVAYIGNRRLEMGDVESRPPSRDEVRLRVAYVGLCGTDLHILHGNMDARVRTPLVFGHEMSGTIDARRRRRHRLERRRRGHRHAPRWDGTCPACLAGNTHICQHLDFIGIDSPGSLQGLWNVPARHPRSPARRHRASTTPRSSNPSRWRCTTSADRELVPGQKAVVIGGGPIGVLIAIVARRFGGDVVVIELDAQRRAQIEGLGFTTLDPRPTDQVAGSSEWSGRRRRGCRVRGLGRRRSRARRDEPREGARHDRRRRDPPDAARNRPAARVLARAQPARRPRLPATRLRDRRRTRRRRGASPPTSSSRRIVPLEPDPGRFRRPRSGAGDEDPRGRREARHERPLLDLAGPTAVVTGASRGIGFAMAVALAEAGADIIGVSATIQASGSAIERAVTRPRAAPSRRIACDFADRDAVDRPRRRRLRSARVDILVNNAGTIERAPAAEHPLELWDRVIAGRSVEPVRPHAGARAADAGARVAEGHLHRVAAELPGRHQRARATRRRSRASRDSRRRSRTNGRLAA